MNIKILNLNIMHGRNTKTPVWPIFLPKEQVEKNLLEIAMLIKKYDPDIVSLQEVDRNSISNGKIDELKELNKILQYPYTAYGNHFQTPLATFGTAILSKFPLQNTISHRFLPALPTPRKGFIVTDIELAPDKMITFISLHTTWINYLYPNTRHIQLEKIKKAVAKRVHPVIYAGDFNDEFVSTKNTTLSYFIKSLNLKAYDPMNAGLKTYPSNAPHERIDWVLIPGAFEFVDYTVLNDQLSDHLPILTNINI